MKVVGIAAGPDNEFSVLLADSEDKFILPIAIGPFEAQAIAIPLSGEEPPRPLTHDLLKSVCDALDGVVQHIVITGIKEGVYYAEVHIQNSDKTIVVDSRPSDAIALAVRCICPIYMVPRLVEFTYEYKDLITRG
ncbi:MAG: bifunctional nuclease family protein [Firmicutes bacterium]|jgi:bifunctional DNase/RNase|nr:bifunctional nuclease family protein [Bacillota bacterium]